MGVVVIIIHSILIEQHRARGSSREELLIVQDMTIIHENDYRRFATRLVEHEVFCPSLIDSEIITD